MPEIKKVEIETEETPQPQPTVAESQLQMAVTFGQMTEANRQLMQEISETKIQQQSMGSMLTEALQEIRELRSQTATISRREEQLSESQQAITSAIAANSEKEESSEAIPVTPMETHVQIDQTPVGTKKSLLQRIFF